MNVFFLLSIVMVATLGTGLLLMALFVGASRAVITNETAIEEREKREQSVNPNATAGFPIPTQLDYEQQVLEARRLAAARAARLPRGANMRIGRLGTTDAHKDKKVTTVGIESDPMSAVKIAQFHSWNGLQYVSPTRPAGGAVAAGPTKMVQRKLVAGEDYQVTPVSADMSGAERRAAIIANAKAKAAAYKALKESGGLMVEQSEAAPAAAAAPAATAVAAPASAAAIPEPEYIEITDGMSSSEKRQAKIKNAKMKSAYNKALKQAGIDPSSVGAQVQAAPAAAPEPAAAAAAPAAATNGAPAANLPPKPDLTEITDDMSSAEKRQAKIENAKAKSAYKKALKELGIDPKTVDI